MAFKQGHSKTGGRKKGSKNKTTLEKQIVIDFLTQRIIETKESWVNALVEAMGKGDVKAIKEGLDRVLGKAKTELDITTRSLDFRPDPVEKARIDKAFEQIKED